MFFFFVGGLEQQTGRVLQAGAARCIGCGSKADLVEYDKVLKVFFVPVWRWAGKGPLLHCSSCNLFFPPSLTPMRCRSCEAPVEPGFRFCPLCGSSL